MNWNSMSYLFGKPIFTVSVTTVEGSVTIHSILVKYYMTDFVLKNSEVIQVIALSALD